MIDRQPDLLPDLQPPSGGLARLRARRAATELASEQGGFGIKAYAPLLAGVCTALLLVLWWPDKQSLTPTLATDRLLGARSDGPSLHLLADDSAAHQLKSSQPDVRLYWTESMQAAAATNSTPSQTP